MINVSLDWAPDKPVYKQLWPGNFTRFVGCALASRLKNKIILFRYIRIHFRNTSTWNGRWIMSEQINSERGYFWSKF